MRAVIYDENLSIDHPHSLKDVELAEPNAGEHELLIRVEAISVNPVDVKIRAGVEPAGGRVLGWDAVGVVEHVGELVQGFQVGERVWYAGELNRQGSNAELQVVDARIVSRAPRSLDVHEAAALPLTGLTAWELLFDRFKLTPGKTPTDQVLLVTGAAGGVGSILIQLAARYTALSIVATAGRPESAAWVRQLGAHHVLDYNSPLSTQLDALGLSRVTHIASLTHTQEYLPQFVDILAPFGELALIDDPSELDITPLKRRSLTVHWELMFTRSLFQTSDLARQSEILSELAALVDAQLIRTTFTEHFGVINAHNLKRAHALIESGRSRGKITLSGFGCAQE